MRLEADEAGIRLVEKGTVRCSMRWGDIERVEAFKRDARSYDMICLTFKPVGKDEFWEIDMDMPGYDVVTREMERRLTGVDPEWWRRAAFATAERGLTTVFQRETAGQA